MKGTEEEETSKNFGIGIEDEDANPTDLLEEIQTILAGEKGRLNDTMICGFGE